MRNRVYLDWNATTPLRGEAKAAMAAALELVGNPSSIHAEGRAARGLVEQARAKLIPVIYPQKHFVEAGGLMSYASEPVSIYRQAATYLDRVLRGEKAADLPVQAPRKYDLKINLKTAREIGLVVPNTLLVFADEVIE